MPSAISRKYCGRRERRCLRTCCRPSGSSTTRTTAAVSALSLLSGVVLFAAVLKLADAFNPALSIVCRLGAAGRHRHARPVPRWGSGRRRPVTLALSGNSEPDEHPAINGYGERNEGWMRTRDGPGATYSATGTGGADDGNGVVGSANGSGVQNELRHGEVEIVEATERSMEAAAKQSVPLKVMVFVDGTWLYYSFYGRGERCHVSAKLGPGWAYEYRVKWEMLPVIVSRALHAQLSMNGQSSRLVEVVRTVVFSSSRRDTQKESFRSQMFKSMREQNFEVHMATTMGVQEKCIDIALAVEMMHYATIPDTYDVGVLVTGDKDFMPAMSRTRQKGRRVCLCSMRNSCNADLLRGDAHVMDFAPIWINEHLEDMMEYAPHAITSPQHDARVPPEILCEIISNLVKRDGGTITSRELGRELQKVEVSYDGTHALTVVKETWGSLTRFLQDQSDTFQLRKARADPDDPSIRQWTVSVVDHQNSMKSVKLGEVTESVYDNGTEDEQSWEGGGNGGGEQERETAESLSLLKVTELKELLRKRGLPVSGKKSALVDRLVASLDHHAAAAASPSAHKSTRDICTPPAAVDSSSRLPLVPTDVRRGGDASTGVGGGRLESASIENRRNVHAVLVDLVEGVLEEEEAKYGKGNVSSREIGRVLARLNAPDGSGRSALAYLKEKYTSLMSFLRVSPDIFTVEAIGADGEFVVFNVTRGRGKEVRRSGEGGGSGTWWGSGEERRRNANNTGGTRPVASGSSAGDSSTNRGEGSEGW